MRDCLWADKHDILRGQYDLRTPDLKLAILNRMQNSPLTDFDFITVTGNWHESSVEESIAKSVSSMVIQDPTTNKFLLMRCGKGESETGKLSLIGGAEETGEGRRDSARRGAQEEAGVDRPYEGGLVGTYINRTSRGDYANVAAFAYFYPDRSLQTLTGFEDEVEELIWMGIGKINAKYPEDFRTPDTHLAIRHAVWLQHHCDFFDEGLVKRVSYKLPV